MKIQMFDKDGNPLGEFEGEINFDPLPLCVPNKKEPIGFILECGEAQFTVKIDDPLRLWLNLGMEPMDTAEAVEDWLSKQQEDENE